MHPETSLDQQRSPCFFRGVMTPSLMPGGPDVLAPSIRARTERFNSNRLSVFILVCTLFPSYVSCFREWLLTHVSLARPLLLACCHVANGYRQFFLVPLQEIFFKNIILVTLQRAITGNNFCEFLYQLHDSVRYRKVCLRISYVIDRRVTVLVGRVVGVQSGRCTGGPVRTRRGHGQMAGSKCPKVAFRHNFGAARLGLWSPSGHDVHQRTGRTERGRW